MEQINEDVVRNALADLSRDRVPEESPLISLCAVTRDLRGQGMNDTPAARMYVVGKLLSALAEANLTKLRAAAGLPPIERQGVAGVVADFSVNHSELEAWSAIYHVYLRPDLNLDLRQITVLLGDRHRRTVQRRLRRGVLTLTCALFETETAARRAERRDTAMLALPRLPESAAEDLPRARSAAAAMSEDGPFVLVISGPPGSGKTTLAALVAREMSQTKGCDVNWVEESDRARRLTELGLDGGLPTALGSAPSSPRAVTVLDECDDLAAVRMLESMPRPQASIIVTTICTPAIGGLARRIVRRPLLPAEALETLRRGLATLDLPDDDIADEHLITLVDACEGTRLALQLAVQQLRVMSLDTVVASLRGPSGFGVALIERLWRRRWLQAPPGIRDIILAGSDAGRRRLDIGTDGSARPEFLSLAVEMGLLACHGSVLSRSYGLPPFLGQYLRLERGRVTTIARSYAASSPRTAIGALVRAEAS